ncbi:EH domain-binding protein 1-like [Acropora muricata]|uniref:EH domain-binding protein 1-like n=1 Tax=Acropora muricata TaxID=159855 RepID=UPI0034E605A7
MSSVMLQDGIPYRTKEELVKEILQEAAEGAAKNKAGNIPVGNNKGGVKSAKSKPLLPVNTFVAPRQQTNSGVDNFAAKELKIKDVKTSSAQHENEEKKSGCSEDAHIPFCKGKKRNNKGRKSSEESSPGESTDMKQLALASEASSLTKGKVKEMCKGHETSNVEKKEKEDKKIPLLPAEDFKDSQKMKSANIGESVAAVEDSGEERSSSDNSGGSVQTIIEKQEPRKSGEELQECLIRSDNGVSKGLVSSDDKAAATGREEQTSADADAERMEKEKLTCFFNKLLKGSPPNGNKIITSVRGPTKASCPGSNKNKAIASVQIESLPTYADAEEEEKQRLTSFFNKLIKPAPHKATRTQHCPQLSAYVAEEMNSLRNEIAAVDKVLLKLEREIQQTMNIADCTEEYKGLTQDWLSLIDYRGELTSRRNTLQILAKEEDFEQCCRILRDDLKVLLTLEDWKKTAFHKGQQAELLQLIFTFVNKKQAGN